LLKEKSWPSIPKDYLSKIYNVLLTLPPLSKNELTEEIIVKLEDNKITSSDIKKVISIFLKSKLIILSTNDEDLLDKNCWQLVKNDNYLSNINVAFIARLISGCIENDIELDVKVVAKCLYGTNKKDKLLQLIEQGNVVYKEIKQKYGQKHGNVKIKQ
jgi:hypothetical protein